MKLIIIIAAMLTTVTTTNTTPESSQDSEKDDDTSRKIIGSSVVTSVSVILNGEEPPRFSDATGKLVPRPLVPPQVASPINLLNPDRYEFYTFNDSGDLIKRLMTMKEIQSIVAGGSNDGSMMHHTSLDQNTDENVEDIVTSVQKVLNEEVEAKKNVSNTHNILDTPDVSSTWSIILPAIFGNTGDDIRPHRPQIVMTPDSVIVDVTQKTTSNKDEIKVKPNNSGSANTITDISDKKTDEKLTVTDDPIVHITRKKPINIVFEVSTPRSNIGSYQEHSLDELQSNGNQNISTIGYRRKTTSIPEMTTSTEKNIMASKPTPSRFVTRRRPTTASELNRRRTSTTTILPELIIDDHIFSTEKAKIEEATTITTLKDTETEAIPISLVATTNSDLSEQTTITLSQTNTNSEWTTHDIGNIGTTTSETFTENDNILSTTLQADITTTEDPNVFDSSNSFNQIMESLKDDQATETIDLFTQNKVSGPTTYLDDLTTTESRPVESSDYFTTDREMIEMIKLPSIDITQQINQSNVYGTQEMFVDEKEPVVYDIPTTTDSNTDTTEHIDEATFFIDEALTLPVFEAVKLQYPESSSIFEEKNPIVQQVDNFIHDNHEVFADSLAVESTQNENKVANVVALQNLTLSEYIEQAATVASILSNDADNLPIKEIVNQLVLTPQLRNDEPEMIVTTNLPTKFDDMEILSLQKGSDLNHEDKPNVSYETTVIKETSSVSMSSNQPVEMVNEKPKTTTKNQIKSEVNSEVMSDASTEISVESDVHEVLNMVKLKMPTNEVRISTNSVISLDNSTNAEDEMTTTAATATEIEDNYTIPNEESSTDHANEFQLSFKEQSTITADLDSHTQEDVNSVTFFSTVDSIDTTEAESTDKTSQTMNHPTESAIYSGSFASDILDTIGMIDEDFVANKFNISFTEEEMEDEDVENIGLLSQSTTTTNENPTTKIYNEESTAYNYYKETIENEIIRKLQETLEERLYPKTERIKTDQTSHTTEAVIDTTTEYVDAENIEQFVSTQQSLEKYLDNDVTNPTEQPWKAPTDNLQEETTIQTETYGHTATTTYINSNTELPSTFSTISQNDEVKDNVTQDEVASTTIESTTVFNAKAEEVFIKLGETTIPPPTTSEYVQSENDIPTQATIIDIIPSKKYATLKIDDRTSAVKKPTQQQFRPHQTEQKVFYINTPKPSVKMPPSLNTLKIKVSNSNRRPMPVKLDPAPKQALGLEESIMDTDADILEFTKLCNEIAFTFWKSLTSEGISSARSLVISPFALTSMLAMIFLGARGSTSGEMNEMLRLDDMVTFNPHLIFKNMTESIANTKDSGIANSAFVRELFSDRSKGKILSFYKDKAQQFYSGHVEEVNFNVINDIIRRRTNLLVKRHTWGKITEYLKTNNVWLNPPLAGLSANIFQTDCSKATMNERDGEMFFQVLPAIRQRRLVPIPAAVYKSGFMAGYDPEIDATAVAFGGIDTVSTIFVMPGQQGHSAPGDSLERLESVLMTNAITKNAWRRLLTTLMLRQGLEVQIPRFSHRSFINATYGLQKMGLNELFNFDKADLRGLTGSTTKDMYISDMIQINTFSTCGEDKIGDQHHVELYPAPPIQQRNINYEESLDSDYTDVQRVSSISEEERSLYDPLFDDQKYLELPLPLRPRQARIPEAPRLRFDKPFLYFVRHNPTGMILYMGRFNPRLLP